MLPALTSFSTVLQRLDVAVTDDPISDVSNIFAIDDKWKFLGNVFFYGECQGMRPFSAHSECLKDIKTLKQTTNFRMIYDFL